MRKTIIISSCLIITAVVLSLGFYGRVPDRVDSHWDEQGRVNGTMSRFWGMFLLPLVMAGLMVLFWYLPRIDPINPNFTGFQQPYAHLILAIMAFLLLIHTYIVLWNASIIRFNPVVLISVGIGLLMYQAGHLLKHAKRNWFAGIRTPWTLSSETVWDKTHALGSVLFKATGVVTILSSLFPTYAIWVVLVASLSTTMVTIVYSFGLYRREQIATNPPD